MVRQYSWTSPIPEDGLDKLLRSVRPHTMGRIVIVFGCGGDRDPDKRLKMGQIAAKLADHVIVTDDNPRTEDAGSIRTAVMLGCPDANEIGDRASAIRAGIAMLGSSDCLVIAGKGHEQGPAIRSFRSQMLSRLGQFYQRWRHECFVDIVRSRCRYRW